MDPSPDILKEYIPVHPELKVHSIQEFYSVPKHYLEFLEQDMQTYGSFVQYLRTIHCDRVEYDNILLRMETRIDTVWNRYLNYIREGASQVRLIHMREINRKIWYAANMISIFLLSSHTLSEKVFLGRLEFILGDMDDVADTMKGDSGTAFETWQMHFIIRMHKII